MRACGNSMYLTLEEWAAACHGEIIAGNPDDYVGGRCPGGLSFDSRSLCAGEWFIALKSMTGDGHKYLANATGRGAAGVIVSDRNEYESKIGLSYPDLPALIVPDTTVALADSARALLDKFKPFVVAITGTVGKTTVKENITHICSVKWPTLKTIRNWNTEIGLPMTVFQIVPEHKVAVLECASRGVGQIHYLSMIARPYIAVITSIGPGHLSEFGSIDNVAQAKWELVDGLVEGGTVVAPGDSPYTKQYGSSFDLLTFGLDEGHSVYPIDFSSEGLFTRCTIATPEGDFETTIPGTSRADLINALCATAAAMRIEAPTDSGSERLTLDEIAEALKALPGVSGRMEFIDRPTGIEVIFDAYNSNPLSLANALDALSARRLLRSGAAVGRKVAILGDMLELGENEIAYHIQAGKHLAKLPIDVLITVGKLATLIRESALETRGGDIEGQSFETTGECAVSLRELLRPGDLVLIKASRGLEFERLLDEDW